MHAQVDPTAAHGSHHGHRGKSGRKTQATPRRVLEGLPDEVAEEQCGRRDVAAGEGEAVRADGRRDQVRARALHQQLQAAAGQHAAGHREREPSKRAPAPAPRQDGHPASDRDGIEPALHLVQRPHEVRQGLGLQQAQRLAAPDIRRRGTGGRSHVPAEREQQHGYRQPGAQRQRSRWAEKTGPSLGQIRGLHRRASATLGLGLS